MGTITNLMAQQNIWQLPEGSRVLFATLIVLGAFVLVLGLVPVLQTLPRAGDAPSSYSSPSWRGCSLRRSFSCL